MCFSSHYSESLIEGNAVMVKVIQWIRKIVPHRCANQKKKEKKRKTKKKNLKFQLKPFAAMLKFLYVHCAMNKLLDYTTLSLQWVWSNKINVKIKENERNERHHERKKINTAKTMREEISAHTQTHTENKLFCSWSAKRKSSAQLPYLSIWHNEPG